MPLLGVFITAPGRGPLGCRDSGEFAGNLFVQYLPHPEGDDDGVVVFEEAIYFAEGVFQLPTPAASRRGREPGSQWPP
jgi:hypothetical protein